MDPITLACTGLALLACNPVTAQPRPIDGVYDVLSATITYADLDLGKPEGVRALVGRVKRAASKLCTENGRRGLEYSQSDRRCVEFAIEHSQAQIDRAVASRPASRANITLSAR